MPGFLDDLIIILTGPVFAISRIIPVPLENYRECGKGEFWKTTENFWAGFNRIRLIPFPGVREFVFRFIQQALIRKRCARVVGTILRKTGAG